MQNGVSNYPFKVGFAGSSPVHSVIGGDTGSNPIGIPDGES